MIGRPVGPRAASTKPAERNAPIVPVQANTSAIDPVCGSTGYPSRTAVQERGGPRLQSPPDWARLNASMRSGAERGSMMGLFGKSFEEKVQEAIDGLRGKFPAVRGLGARVSGKIVTLEGEAPSMEVKGAVMAAFNALVETDNTINTIRVKAAAPAPPPGPAPSPQGAPAAAAGAETIHVVVSGDTLGALAKKYYGKASLYPKIFEANKDILKNPDLIKIGQKLRIPK